MASLCANFGGGVVASPPSFQVQWPHVIFIRLRGSRTSDLSIGDTTKNGGCYFEYFTYVFAVCSVTCQRNV